MKKYLTFLFVLLSSFAWAQCLQFGNSPFTYVEPVTPGVVAESWCLSFDGSNDYVGADGAGLPATASARTIMGWVNDSSPSGTDEIAFSYGSTSGSGNFSVGFGLNSANTVGLYIGGGYCYQPYTRSAGWVHLAATMTDGATLGDVKIWVNGTEITSTRYYDVVSAGSALNTGVTTFAIGDVLGEGYGSVYKPLSGKVCEVSVWSRALSQSEIQNYMYYQPTSASAGLVRYYKVREGTGTSLDDVSAGDYAATLYNSPTWSTRGITMP